MSTSSTPTIEADNESPKFTRGEKCIFTHLIVTISLIIFLIIIYFIHLCFVTHAIGDFLKFWHSSFKPETSPKIDANLPIGLVFLRHERLQLLCNTVLLQARWSVGPAHCAAMRTDPDMAPYLLSWGIRYAGPDENVILETKIKRTIPHPHFDREDFRNNVGLFEHEVPIDLPYFVYSTGNMNFFDDPQLMPTENSLSLVTWINNSTAQGDDQFALLRFEVQPIATTKCIRFISPILDIRPYEYCVLLRSLDEEYLPEHGSVLVLGSEIKGIFGWGEKSGRGVPCIIVDLKHFNEWLDNIIAW